MKTTYRGFEIEVTRGKSMAGYEILFYSVFRVVDGWEADSGFSESAETVRDFVKIKKQRIDNELADPESGWNLEVYWKRERENYDPRDIAILGGDPSL